MAKPNRKALTQAADNGQTESTAPPTASEFFSNALAALGRSIKDSRLAFAELVRAAIVGGKDGFSTARDAAYAAIRANMDNLAVSLDAEPTTDGKAYTVPGSLRVQVAWIMHAVESRPSALGTVEAPATSTILKDLYANRPDAGNKRGKDKSAKPDATPATGPEKATVTLPEGMEAKAARAAIRAVAQRIADGVDTLEGEVLAVVHARLYELAAYLEAEARRAPIAKAA